MGRERGGVARRVLPRSVTERYLAYGLLLPSVVLLVGLIIHPLFNVALLGFHERSLLGGGSVWVGLDNFSSTLTSSQFQSALMRSVVWTLGSLVGEMMLGLAAALLLHVKFPGRGLMRAVVLFPYLIPTVVTVLVWRFLFHDLLGLANHLLITIGLIRGPVQWLAQTDTAMASVIFVETWKSFPFVVVALLGILQTIPTERYEAARVDGAGPITSFLYITWPAIVPTFLVTAMVRTIWTLDSFDVIYLLTGGGPVDATTTLPILIYFRAFVDWNIGSAAALATLMLVGLIGLVLIYTKLAERAEAKL